MEFYRIENQLVANQSLRSFFVDQKSETFFALVFLENLPTLPNVGVSLFPADFLHLHRLSPVKTVAFQTWENFEPNWLQLKVEKYSFLKISVVFKDECIGLQFQFEPSSVNSRLHFYRYPAGFNEAYLAIAGEGLIDQTDKCSLALLNSNQFMNYMTLRAVNSIQNVETSVVNKVFDLHDCHAGSAFKEKCLGRPALSLGKEFCERNCTDLSANCRLSERRFHFSNKTDSNLFDNENSANTTTESEASSCHGVESSSRQMGFIASKAEDFFKNGCKISFSSKFSNLNLKEGKKKGKSVVKAVEKEYTDDEEEYDVSSEGPSDENQESDPAVEKEFESTACAICHEKEIRVLFLPCRHASICEKCHQEYVSMERKKQGSVFSNKPRREEDVTCLLCRKKIEMIAYIYINSRNCLFCGCNTMDAVAGGVGGCGCLIGCYDKAVESLRKGGNCPYCKAKLVEIVKTYVGGVFY